MSMWTAKEKSLNYDQAKADAARAQKDIKMVNKKNTLKQFLSKQFSQFLFLKPEQKKINIIFLKSQTCCNHYLIRKCPKRKLMS